MYIVLEYLLKILQFLTIGLRYEQGVDWNVYAHIGNKIIFDYILNGFYRLVLLNWVLYGLGNFYIDVIFYRIIRVYFVVLESFFVNIMICFWYYY